MKKTSSATGDASTAWVSQLRQKGESVDLTQAASGVHTTNTSAASDSWRTKSAERTYAAARAPPRWRLRRSAPARMRVV